MRCITTALAAWAILCGVARAGMIAVSLVTVGVNREFHLDGLPRYLPMQKRLKIRSSTSSV